MANLEVGIGADNSEFLKKIKETEKEIENLSKQKVENIKLGIDTKELDSKLKDAKKSLNDLKSTLKDTGGSFADVQKPVANAGNTLTNFSRIAQDAPFGIIGIGNNLTATAESFASLSKQAGGAGGALKALAGSLMGGGGVLLAISLVTTALTVMSQKGITVGDVFDKLTGNFDEFKKGLQEVNKEAEKSGNEQAASVGAFVSAAKNINLSMHDRLIAVQKLQDEYPGYFGNLTKEQILNGDVSGSVKEVTKALIAKAKAQAFSEKIGVLAQEAFGLREKETELIKQQHAAIERKIQLEKEFGDVSKHVSDRDRQRLFSARGELIRLNDELSKVQNPLRANLAEQTKWTDEINKTTAASIKLEDKTPKAIKPKKIKIERPDIEIVDPLKPMEGLDPFKINKVNMFQSLVDNAKASRESTIADLENERLLLLQQYGLLLKPLPEAVLKFNEEMSQLLESSIVSTFGSLGESIGEALASGGSVIEAAGASIVGSMGTVLSAIGDKLIALGAASLLASTVFSSFGTALGVGAALAAIAGGVALKAGGSIFSGISKGMTSGNDGKNSVSAGNSVSSPTSSVSGGGSFVSGPQTVVFEISGQSLVGVLSNTLNKNTKLGGAPAI